MKPEQQRIAIAEATGVLELVGDMWHVKRIGFFVKLLAEVLPDYLSDLNAMHEAEKVLIARGGLPTYEHFLQLNEVSDDDKPWYGSIHATSSQRAEAFLRTLNLWTD